MKKPLFLAAALLLSMAGLSPAQAQSVWTNMPGAHAWDPATFAIGGYGHVTLENPQPGALWGLEEINRGLGQNWNALFNTENNGQTWTYASGLAAGSIYNWTSLDGRTAWILKSISGVLTLLRTTSGPAGFQVVNAALPAPFSKLVFFDASTGIAASSNGIYRTTDAGVSWSLVPGTPAPLTLYSGLVLTKVMGSCFQMALQSGQILSTQDAGLTWHVSPTSYDGLRGFAFTDALHGLAYGCTATNTSPPVVTDWLARTSDGGLNWTPVVPVGRPRCATVTALRDVPNTYVGGRDSLSSSTGLPVDGFGQLVISRDGGTTWTMLSNNFGSYGSHWNYDGQLLSIRPGELLLATAPMSRATPPRFYMFWQYAGAALAARKGQPAVDAVVAYPNPSRGLVELAGPLGAGSQVRVYDATGRLRQQEALSPQQRQLDLSALPAGLYQLVLTTADGQVSRQPVSKE